MHLDHLSGEWYFFDAGGFTEKMIVSKIYLQKPCVSAVSSMWFGRFNDLIISGILMLYALYNQRVVTGYLMRLEQHFLQQFNAKSLMMLVWSHIL
ncbi:MAG: hypothetical protein U1E88_05790 [Acinetobacter sp.]